MDRRDERIRELERQVTELRTQNAQLLASVEDYKNKEQTISSAIIASMEHANKLETSQKKILSLDIQRTRLLYLKMEQVINDLYRKYPELRKDSQLKDMSEKFKSIVFNDLGEKSSDPFISFKKPTVVDDPIKKLLHNIIDCFDTKDEKPAKEIKPVPVIKETPAEKLTAQPVVKDVYSEPVSSSGFDFNEALHPTMELDEILKSFDLGKKDTDKDKK